MSSRPNSPVSFRVFVALFVAALCCISSFGQQSKVLAPHRPVPPILPYSAPSPGTYQPHFLRGGFWITDSNTKASVYLHNFVETAPIVVTPIIYLSNGTKLPLPPVTLEPAGASVISINESLAANGIAPYATLSGYLELQYSWAWSALCATVTSVDIAHSVIFTFGLSSTGVNSTLSVSQQTGAAQPVPTQDLEGVWWKQEVGVTGFVALSNTTEKSRVVAIQVSDAGNKPLGSYSVTVSPRGTKRVNLAELAPVTSSLGGLRITYTGSPDDVIVNGGLEDTAKGYSASMPFRESPSSSAETATLKYAEIGLMTGAADPMMHFPANTIFTPYSILRNVSSRPVSVTPVIYWMKDGAALSAQLASFSIAPLQANSLDVSALMTSAGIKDLNGAINLVLETNDLSGALVLASGSVDLNYNYVFEVTPSAVKESMSKSLAYWSTANGDDTMVTLWNPADEAQDFVYTLFYTGGKYLLPLHLEPKSTRTLNISEIIESQVPDSVGNVISSDVHEGSAKISGVLGELQSIVVSVDSGVYNVRKATCHPTCIQCGGMTGYSLTPSPVSVIIGSSTQLTFDVQFSSGTQANVTNISTWAASPTGIVNVSSSGLVTGVAEGSTTITGTDPSVPVPLQMCGMPPECPGGGALRASVSSTVQIPTSVNVVSAGIISGSYLYACNPAVDYAGGCPNFS